MQKWYSIALNRIRAENKRLQCPNEKVKIQSITQKTTDWEIQTPLKIVCEYMCFRKEGNSFSTIGIRRVIFFIKTKYIILPIFPDSQSVNSGIYNKARWCDYVNLSTSMLSGSLRSGLLLFTRPGLLFYEFVFCQCCGNFLL